MTNKTTLLILMAVLIAFITLLITLAVVFIVALRKRAPVVKIVMAPKADETADADDAESDEEEAQAQTPPAPAQADAPVRDEAAAQEPTEAPAPVQPVAESVPEQEDDIDDDATAFVVEGQERVRYDRSLVAKLAQLKKESKDWYSEIKNELLSYERVKVRMSWRRETFRIGRMSIARFMVRGKTLCLLLAVEASGYAGTKYSVEDMSATSSLADTPTLYRIKSTRRLKYAKEMIAGIMRELKIRKSAYYEPDDFFMPYEGDMAFMQRGLVKRVVSTSTRTFKIEEAAPRKEAAAVDAPSAETPIADAPIADTTDDTPVTDTPNADTTDTPVADTSVDTSKKEE